ncbi:MAG: acyl-CoA desaturase, partial [bacterium]|nr:acyl-CoA desaturase [bacterium]
MSIASPPKNKRKQKQASSKVAAPRRSDAKSKPEAETNWMKKAYPDGFNWGIIGWVIVLHLGAMAAPFFFSWEGLAMVFVLHWITGGLGICLGYHRLFTHSSFKTWGPIRFALAVIGGMAGEGSAIDWVADHRKHHALSDKEGDPHSPHEGPWWSHMLWFAGHKPAEVHQAKVLRWAPDLQRDWWMRLAGSLFLPSHFALSFLLLGAGYLYGGWYMAISFLVYAQFLRVVFVLHSTWFVNSASHMWGYTNYETTDDSRNN